MTCVIFSFRPPKTGAELAADASAAGSWARPSTPAAPGNLITGFRKRIERASHGKRPSTTVESSM